MSNNFQECLCNFSMKVLSKAKGKTAKEEYDYINRLGRNKSKEDLVYQNSINMPEFGKPDPRNFWELANHQIHGEPFSGRQAVYLKIALPRALTTKQNIALMEGFISEITNFPEGKLPCSCGFHNDATNHNPHFHALIYERPTFSDKPNPSLELFFKKRKPKKTQLGGTKKVTCFKGMSAPRKFRKLWAEIANKHLEMANSDFRMDPLSYAERGIDKIPQKHLGAKCSYMLKQGIVTERAKINQRIEKLNKLSDEKIILRRNKTLYQFYRAFQQASQEERNNLPFLDRKLIYQYYTIFKQVLHTKSTAEAYSSYFKKHFQDLYQTDLLVKICQQLLIDGYPEEEIWNCMVNDFNNYPVSMDLELTPDLEDEFSYALEMAKYNCITKMQWVDQIETIPELTENDFLEGAGSDAEAEINAEIKSMEESSISIF